MNHQEQPGADAELAHLHDEVARLRAELDRRTPKPRNGERDREIRRLRAGGWRHKAIAARFNMTEGAVRQVCHRGRRKALHHLLCHGPGGEDV
jgi:DNA-directed RNA polymerase specialized sigma24 family protein